MNLRKNNKQGILIFLALLITITLAFAVFAATKQDISEQITRADKIITKGTNAFDGNIIDDISETSGSEGGTSWWWTVPILLIILALAYGGIRVYRKKQEGNVQTFENRIIELLRISADFLVHIGEKLNMTQGTFSTREKALWSQAVEAEQVPFHRLTDNQIIKHITTQVQVQLNSKHAEVYEFKPNMPAAERSELVLNVSTAVSNIVIARKLITNFIHKKLTDRVTRLERLERRNSEILESPVVHADRSVTFMYNTAHSGASSPSTNNASTPVVVRFYRKDMENNKKEIDMNLRRTTIWEARSPPLEPGTYMYHFLVMRQGQTQQQPELDPRNNYGIETVGKDQNQKQFNTFEITGPQQPAQKPTINSPQGGQQKTLEKSMDESSNTTTKVSSKGNQEKTS